MASFSTGNQAAEIDFEDEAGQEMIDFLESHLDRAERRAGACLLEYREHSIPCRIEVKRSARWSPRFRVSWTPEPRTQRPNTPAS
jgi:hypothetical protein